MTFSINAAIHDEAHSILKPHFMIAVAVILSARHLFCITLCIVLLLQRPLPEREIYGGLCQN